MAEATDPPAVTVHTAERDFGPDRAADVGDEITDARAAARLQSGQDVVACGPERRANRNKTMALIALAFGEGIEHKRHDGTMSLPHFHDRAQAVNAHPFFEEPPRHARKGRLT